MQSKFARKQRNAKTLLDDQYKHRQSISCKKRDYDKTLRDVHAHTPYRRGAIDAPNSLVSLESVTKHKLFHDDEEKLATFLLSNCMEDIAAMFTHDSDPEPGCAHVDIRPNEREGCESCADCGETFATLLSETGWMDGVREGTHTVARKHLYDRKAYFRNNLRCLFAQSNARQAPPEVLRWAREQQASDGRQLLDKMKRAPKSVRDELRLPRFYKIAHTIQQDVTNEKTTELFANTEDLILHMYDGCLNAFVSVRDEFGRRSFLNKFYVMRQLLRLVHMSDEVLSMVPQMRMKSKIREHDTIWRRVCEYLNWQYAPLCQ